MKTFGSNQLKFDKTYLSELTEEPDSGVFKQTCKYHIALHPAQLNEFGDSVKDELGKKIARYDESFEGIMLGYEKVKLQSELGVIGPDNCYIHLDVQALFYVFRPEIGMILKGTVTRTTKDHVGCLVYNTFNISIPRPDSDNSEKTTWLGENVAVKSEVEFKITYVDLNARLPHIRGELRSILTTGGGNESTISPSKSEKKNKKERHSSASVEKSLHTGVDIPIDFKEEDVEPRKKHKKKRHSPFSEEKSLHTEINIPMDFKEEDIEDVETRKKPKKKRHSSVSEHKSLHTDFDITMGFKVESSESTAEMLGFDSEWETPKQRKSKLKEDHKAKHRKSTSADPEIDIKKEDIKKEETENESIIKSPTKSARTDTHKTSKHKKKSKKEKNKEKHRKSEDLDLSLESLDLNSLFANTSWDFDSSQNQVSTADNTDKKSRRKRSQSISQELHLDQIKLEVDSDFERITR